MPSPPLTTQNVRTIAAAVLTTDLSVYVLPDAAKTQVPSIWAGEPPEGTKIKTELIQGIEYPVGGGIEAIVLKTPSLPTLHHLNMETTVRRRFTIILRQWDTRKGLQSAIEKLYRVFEQVDFGGIQPAQNGRLEQANLYVVD